MVKIILHSSINEITLRLKLNKGGPCDKCDIFQVVVL